MLDAWGTKAQVNLQCLPRLGEDVPGGGDNALPQPGGEQQNDVDDAVEHPQHRRQTVPVSAQADVLPTRQTDQRERDFSSISEV